MVKPTYRIAYDKEKIKQKKEEKQNEEIFSFTTVRCYGSVLHAGYGVC